MDKRVYAHQKKFKEVFELEEMVHDVWESLGQKHLSKIYRIIQRRRRYVIYIDGGK